MIDKKLSEIARSYRPDMWSASLEYDMWRKKMDDKTIHLEELIRRICREEIKNSSHMNTEKLSSQLTTKTEDALVEELAKYLNKIEDTDPRSLYSFCHLSQCFKDLYYKRAKEILEIVDKHRGK